MAKLTEPGYQVEIVCNKAGIPVRFVYTTPYSLSVSFTPEQWSVIDQGFVPMRKPATPEFPYCFKNGRPVWWSMRYE